MVGAGIEYAFTSSVSAKLEYNYMDFGKRTYYFLIDDVPIDVTVRQNLHLIKVGVNWRLDFGKYPVVARY
jgi:opacity protein-like surface antigen